MARHPWDIRMPWARYEAGADRAISGSNGVFEIADNEGNTLYLGSAGARDLFGLRGRIAAHFAAGAEGVTEGKAPGLYRYEVTSAYLSRWAELLGRYWAEHGALPLLNQVETEDLSALPRFSS